ncbi:trefoil factor 2-like [Anomaloglossus baeobatrachus]|uniref:trefoil factor 2-like n=1 Tax=Anomaloglossus baeobatrachus TaxID=238106 RepID=UPI003F50050B
MDTAILSAPALVLLLLPLLTTAAADMCNCLTIGLEDRHPCGDPGISFDQCKAMGCCYDPRFSGHPTCFLNLVKEPKIVATHQQSLGNPVQKLFGLFRRDTKEKEKEGPCNNCAERPKKITRHGRKVTIVRLRRQQRG